MPIGMTNGAGSTLSFAFFLFLLAVAWPFSKSNWKILVSKIHSHSDRQKKGWRRAEECGTGFYHSVDVFGSEIQRNRQLSSCFLSFFKHFVERLKKEIKR